MHHSTRSLLSSGARRRSPTLPRFRLGVSGVEQSPAVPETQRRGLRQPRSGKRPHSADPVRGRSGRELVSSASDSVSVRRHLRSLLHVTIQGASITDDSTTRKKRLAIGSSRSVLGNAIVEQSDPSNPLGVTLPRRLGVERRSHPARQLQSAEGRESIPMLSRRRVRTATLSKQVDSHSTPSRTTGR